MTNGAVVAGAAASTATSMRVAGTLIKLDPYQFVDFVNRHRSKGIVVAHSLTGLLSKSHVYVTGVHGLVFYCKSSEPLPILVDVEAKSIRII